MIVRNDSNTNWKRAAKIELLIDIEAERERERKWEMIYTLKEWEKKNRDSN